jgi:hypothetical protein
VTDYSQMSYSELFRIANNDAIANAMSEEEYEALSVELWKKFGVEKRIAAPPDPSVLSPELKRPNAVRSILNALRIGPAQTQAENSRNTATPRPRQQPSLFRSGD